MTVPAVCPSQIDFRLPCTQTGGQAPLQRVGIEGWHAMPVTGEEGVREISLDATSTSVLDAVSSILQAAVGGLPHLPERSLGCRIKTGSLQGRL